MDRIKRGSREFRTVNLAFFAAGFVTFVTLYDVQPLLPVFSAEYRVPAAMASLPLSVATGALAVTMLLAGTISETWGKKPVMVLSLFLTSLIALATPCTHTMGALLALRVMQGAVLAGLPAVAMAYLGEEIDPPSLSGAMGLYIAGNAVGGMTGRIFTAAVTEMSSWRLAIGIIGLVCLLLSYLFSRKLPQSRNFRQRPFRVRYLFTSLGQHLRDPELVLLYVIAFLVTGSFVTMYNYITFRLLAPPYRMSHTAVSALFLVYLVGSFTSASMGRVIRRFGRDRTLLFFLAAMALGTIVTLGHPVVMTALGIVLFTAGFFGVHTIASSWVGARAVTAKAQASSLYLFFYYLGSSISGTLGGLFWTGSGWGGVVGMICGLLLIAFFVARRLVNTSLGIATCPVGSESLAGAGTVQ